MNSFQWYDWVRVATIVLCVIALARIVLRIIKDRGRHPEYLSEFSRVLLASIAFIAVNSGERIIDNNGVHIGFFIGFAIAIYACTMSFREPKPINRKDHHD